MIFTIESLRQFRIGEYAIFDIVVSFLGIYLLAPLFSKFFRKFRIEIPKISWVYLTLPVGIFIHLITGQITLMTKNFIDLNGYYALKMFIFALLFLGIRGIKIIRNKS